VLMAPTFAIPQTLREALRLAADLSDTVDKQKLEIATLVSALWLVSALCSTTCCRRSARLAL
jgi:hypothetical protein